MTGWHFHQCEFSGCTERLRVEVSWRGRTFRLCGQHARTLWINVLLRKEPDVKMTVVA